MRSLLLFLFILTLAGYSCSNRFDGGNEKPLSINAEFPYYFSGPDGNPLVLAGDYTWQTFSGEGYDYNALFESMKERGLNLSRVWLWWGCENISQVGILKHIEPFMRTGPGTANDGKPRYDLATFNEAFFRKLTDFCKAADENGIYLQLIMMDAWMIKHPNLWQRHAFNAANNINGIDGDPAGTGRGTDGEAGFCSVGNAKGLEFQKAYIKKVVETVNVFNNVFFEIANENYYSEEWELMLCDYIKELERSLTRQHMTIRRDFPSHSYVVQKWDPELVHSGIIEKRKLGVPLLFDTDWIINDNDDQIRRAAWTAIASGGHFSYMDDELNFYHDSLFTDRRQALHRQIDHLAKFIREIHPWELSPDDVMVKSGLAFLMSGENEIFAYLPEGGEIILDLGRYRGKVTYQWYDPATGVFGDKQVSEAAAATVFSAPVTKDIALIIRK